MGTKVAVSAVEPSLTAQVGAHFGRCPVFVVVDTGTMEWTVLHNVAAHAGGGAGPQTAEVLGRARVQVVLTGICGPNAHQALAAAGIRVVTDVFGRVDKAVEAYIGTTYAHDRPHR